MPPNPKCIVCSTKPQVVVKIDTNRVTVKQFRDEVLVKSLNMIDPDVIEEVKGSVLISSEEGETEGNNEKLLAVMGIVDGCILKVDDFFQNYEITIIIAHKEVEREDSLFEVIADLEALKAENSKGETNNTADDGEPKAKKARHEGNGESDDDMVLIEDDDVDLNKPSTSSNFDKNWRHESMKKNNIDDGNDNESVEEEIVQNDNAPSTSNESDAKLKVFSSLKRSRANDGDDDIILVDSD